MVAVLVPVASSALSTARVANRAWHWQNPRPQGNAISALAFPSASIGYAAGDSGVILKSVNAGGSWVALDTGSAVNYHGASFPATSTGWLVGQDGAIVHTANGGSTFASQTSGTSATLRGVASVNTSAAIVVGDAFGGSATIRYTASGGATWTAGTTTSTAGLNAVAFHTPALAWAVGGNGTMLRSADGGATWTSYAAPTAASLNSIAFAPGSTVGYAVGNNVGTTWTILKTVDGVTWSPLTLPGTGSPLLAVACGGAGGAEVVVAGASGVVYHSSNGGATWTVRSPSRLANVTLACAAMASPAQFHLGGDFGTLLVSRDAGATWLSQMQESRRDLFDSVFTTANDGWAVGADGLLMKTGDGGLTWTGRQIGTGAIRGVASLNLSSAWLVGDAGTILYTTDAGSTWTTQTSGVTAQLNDVYFDSPNKGTVVGAGGTILTTANSGNLWSRRSAGTAQQLNSVWYASNADGWIVGRNGVILRTTTGGVTWSLQSSGTTRTLHSVWAADTQNVFAVGDAGTVLKTANGGATWAAVSSGTTETLRAIAGSSASRVWIGGTRGLVRRTVDGGASWTTQPAGLPSSMVDVPVAVNGLRALDANNVALVAERGHVRLTADGGLTWTPSYYGSFQQLNDIDALSSTQAWTAGGAGVLMNTFDGGNSWFRQAPGTTANLNGVAFPSSTAGWVAGDAGVIRFTSNRGWTWTAQTSGTTARLTDIDAASDANAVAVGDGTIRYYTLAAPAGWKAATGTVSRQFNRVSMPTNSVAFAVASTGAGTTIVKSVDAGATWSSTTTMTSSFFGVHFENSTTGWVVGSGGSIFKTVDGGGTWTAQPSGVTSTLRAVHFTSLLDGRAVGDGGVSLSTTDGGSTWVRNDTGTVTKSLRGAYFYAARQGWAVGSDGSVLNALDLTLPTTTIYVSPSAPDGLDGWYISFPLIELIPSAGSTTNYSWDAAAGPFSPYLTPLVSAEGTHTLHYYSTDTSGQVEPVASRTFRVDATAPTSPTALTVNAIGSSSASLSWTPSTDTISGVDGYEVIVDGSVVGTTELTSFSVTGLTPNTAYTVSVRAYDFAGLRSQPSTSTSIVTADALGQPLGVSLWTAPTAPDGLNGWYVTTPTVTLMSIPTSVPAVINYRFDSSPTTYGPSVSPTSFPAIVGSYSLLYEASATAGPPRPVVTYATSLAVDPYVPAAPIGLTTTATTDSSVQLRWDAVSPTTTPSGLDGYRVYRDGILIDIVAGSATSTVTYTATGLAPNTAYGFAVRSFNVAGSLSATASVSATTEPPPAPPAPRISYARGTDGDTIYLNWEPVSPAVGALSYEVQRSPIDTGAFSHVATVAGQSSFSFVDTGLGSSTAYWYRVRAFDDRGYSAWTTPTASMTKRPERVSGLVAAPNAGGAVLSWQPSSNPAVVGYYVYRSDYSLAGETTLTVAPVVATSYIDPVLPGTYWYRIAAVDASGVVGSASVELRVGVSPPASAATPHGTVQDSSDQCAGCHRGHSATAPNLSVFPFPDATSTAEHTITVRATIGNQATCLGCHNGVGGSDIRTSVESSASLSRHSIETVDLPGSLYCGSCHASHRANTTTDAALLDVNGVSLGNQVCYECHGTASMLPQGDLSIFEQSVHASATPDSAIGVTCTACHTTHASANPQLLTYAGWMLCMQCHGGRTDPRTPDILTLISSGDDHRNRHDVTAEDQAANGGSRISCQNCHNTHAVTATNPLVDPDNPSVESSATWTGDTMGFCIRCHDGLLPTPAQTGDWVEAPLAGGGETTTTNIAFAYQANVHGYRESTSAALFLKPSMGYAVGDILSCRTCHDGHGTVNPMNLRQDVRSADQATVVDGALVAPAPGGYDLRFFCATCHDIDPVNHLAATGGAISIESFPTDCTGCHSHTTQGSLATTATGTVF